MILIEKLVKRYSNFACRRTMKNNLKGSVHIAAMSKFCLLRRSSLVEAVRPCCENRGRSSWWLSRNGREIRGERGFVGGLGFARGGDSGG
ncbi:hypothetical protein H5410_020446 [Solanum commersonii]|uniref:Uncharacterized protein n=1 Tax=Solanum commersonii TaxID=4109 RepID=A0A9J5ZA15_SOLCO|nr:hypothetical protein H5410_020446 [Solanum commersonii]